MAEKIRLDLALFQRGLCQSREKARAVIMSGLVYVNGAKALKAGAPVSDKDKIEIRGEQPPYVSRGGYKLEKAVKSFSLCLDGLECMDVGASTGGFTDCMLQNGAKKVYSIDVGYGQLAWKLRSDSRVVCLERTNFRYLTSEQVQSPVDFASVDVSFISLRLILPVLRRFLKDDAAAVCLIKPQFEAGRDKVGKNGVVKSPETHIQVICDIIDFAVSAGFSVIGLDFSPVKGPQGNIEYLLHIQKSEQPCVNGEISPAETVARSHSHLDKGGEQ